MTSRILQVSIPIASIDENYVETVAYVKELRARGRDYAVHYVFEGYAIFVMSARDAEKLKKMRKELREQWLEEHCLEGYPLVFSERRYVSYPTEWIDHIKIVVPEELIKKMREQNLVLVIVRRVDAYDDNSISVTILRPEDIEQQWEKRTVVLAREELEKLVSMY